MRQWRPKSRPSRPPLRLPRRRSRNVDASLCEAREQDNAAPRVVKRSLRPRFPASVFRVNAEARARCVALSCWGARAPRPQCHAPRGTRPRSGGAGKTEHGDGKGAAEGSFSLRLSREALSSLQAFRLLLILSGARAFGGAPNAAGEAPALPRQERRPRPPEVGAYSASGRRGASLQRSSRL